MVDDIHLCVDATNRLTYPECPAAKSIKLKFDFLCNAISNSYCILYTTLTHAACHTLYNQYGFQIRYRFMSGHLFLVFYFAFLLA